MKYPSYLILFLSLFLILAHSHCIHDEFIQNTTKHYLNDLSEKRFLQTSQEGNIRIFVDYSQVVVGGQTQINTIKRITNITATYFYNILTVKRLPRLYFPSNTSLICNSLKVPEQYVNQGTIGDLGVVCGNSNNADAIYIAKSTPCAFLQSTKRPIWGMMSWNNNFLKYDQEGFQQILFVGVHQMTHILGFSAVMYDLYPNGNPLKQDQEGNNFLSTPRINQEIKKHYNCSSPKGMLLEDQDGTLIASHWEQKVVGNQFMIASNRKGSFMSAFTLALLESTGWYPHVNYEYAEPTVWGKDRGCDFFDPDECEGKQFCQDSSFGCDWDGTAIGRCGLSPFSGTCRIFKYFTNTICVDENYELKNLNSKLNALERGGSSSKCFSSNYRQIGTNKTKLDNRCYISVCSFTNKVLYILVGSYILICTPGAIVSAPPGLQGILTCPSDLSNYCQNKKTCAYHCNKNGACINGQCLCTGSLKKSQTCVDISIFLAPVGTTGGLLTSLQSNTAGLSLDQNGNIINSQEVSDSRVRVVKEYSLNSECIQGSALDVFGDCLECKDIYNCQNCKSNGCISCDDGSAPRDGRCT